MQRLKENNIYKYNKYKSNPYKYNYYIYINLYILLLV